MVGETTKETKSPLLPDRSVQEDFFVCDVFDAVPKGDMASMEHPVFSLSTKPDRRIRRYENGDKFLEITPSVKGLATVHDRDVLIFVISQIMASLNQGKPVERKVRFKAYDLLKATNRATGGESYVRLREALERLAGTQIVTNIITGGVEVIDGFGLIDGYRIVRETRDGRMQDVQVTLSDWVFDAIRNNEVLTLNRDYFRLRKPLERRLYELARKHCNRSKKWRIGIEKLRLKMGSTSTTKEFRRLLRKIIEDDRKHGHFPDYRFEIDSDNLNVYPKSGFVEAIDGTTVNQMRLIFLDGDTYSNAKKAAPGWDIYFLEEQWRGWIVNGQKQPPRDPDKAFIGFCKKWFERKGRP